MTNKPMLSVEREEIERAINLASIFDDGSDGADAESSRSVVGILRAFLDKPVLESQYDGMTQAQAQAVSDGVEEILHGKPAAEGGRVVSKVHMWQSLSMLGLIRVKCGRKVKATQFTSDPKMVTCQACANKMSVKP